MKNLSIFLISIIVCLSLTQCKKADDKVFASCEEQVIINASLYNSSPTDELSINNLEINGNCLIINFSSGGCSGDTWDLKLIDSGVILRSNPEQRNLILSLINEELCEAYITKEVSFDITDLQGVNNQLWLHITNANEGILYTY